ncbi:MAG: YqaE/Pmp3 family membrane protein [Bacteroidota bacterium]
MKKQLLHTLVAVFAFALIATPAFAGSAMPSNAPAMETVDSQENLTKAEKKALKKAEKAEKKAMKKQARKLFWQGLKNKIKADDDKLIVILLAILIPPLGVYLYEDDITSKFWISLVLTILLFWIVGAIYSLLVVTDNI